MAPGNVRLSKMTVAGIYLFLAFLLVWPVVDVGVTAWPISPRSIEWRYGLLGLLGAFWNTPVMATVFAMLLAFFLRHRKTLFGLSYFCFIWAFGLIVVLILFPLDAIQYRAMVPEENQASVLAGAAVAFFKHGVALLTVLLLGWGGMRTGNTMPRSSLSGPSSKQTAEILKAQQRG